MAATSDVLAAKLRRAGLDLIRPERGLAVLGTSPDLIKYCIWRDRFHIKPAFRLREQYLDPNGSLALMREAELI